MSQAGASEVYRILDEPRPGPLAHLTVSPFWVILTLMLGGAWIGWPWFVLNALAIGSATARREIGMCLLGFGLAFAIATAMMYGLFADVLGQRAVPYLMIALPALKMGFGFAVFQMQERSFQLYQHFGGRTRNAAAIAVLAFFAGSRLLGAIDSTFWTLVLM